MDYSHWKTYLSPFNKPVKYIYPDQNEVKTKFIGFILPYLQADKFFKKVWIWGSLARGTFGIYALPYQRPGTSITLEGSDIDLLVEVDETIPIPKWFKEIKDWNKTRTYSRAFFSILEFENIISDLKSVKHTVDFICHFPSIHTKKKFYDKVKESELIYER